MDSPVKMKENQGNLSKSNPIMIPLVDLAVINPTRSLMKIGPDDFVSFIPMADITEGGRWINRQSRKHKEVRQGFTYFEEGDVLFAKITPCMENGKGCHAIGLDNGIGFGTTEFHVLRAREDADPGFIYQWSIYQDLRRQAKNSMTGSAGQQRVPKEFFEKFLVPLLTKPEQAKIAEILSTVDRAIEKTEALIAKQQRIKTGLMQDLLTRGIDEHGNLRSEKTHQFKDSPLGRIPVEWEVRRLGESSEICNNFRKPIAALVRDTVKGDYPYYGPTGILDYINEYRVDGKFVLIGEDGDHFLKFKTQEMTLLVDGKFNVNNHAHILRGKDNVITEWLHLFFLHRDITLYLTRPDKEQEGLSSTRPR